MSILLTNIQRFSLHDGPGIRTTVFLKGCSLRCPWCSNPENMLPQPQKYIKNGISGTYGYYLSADELTKACLRDIAFYAGEINNPAKWSIKEAADIDKLPGGVTFSGGEALLQTEELVRVFTALHSFGVHLAVETCLFISPEQLRQALKYIDFFYVDMKILDDRITSAVEQGSLSIYINNLDELFAWTDTNGNYKPVVIRVPVIGNYTDNSTNRMAVKRLINKYKDKILKIELIKEHNLGKNKYISLGMNMDYHGVDDSLMKQYENELSDMGIHVEICKI